MVVLQLWGQFGAVVLCEPSKQRQKQQLARIHMRILHITLTKYIMKNECVCVICHTYIQEHSVRSPKLLRLPCNTAAGGWAEKSNYKSPREYKRRKFGKKNYKWQHDNDIPISGIQSYFKRWEWFRNLSSRFFTKSYVGWFYVVGATALPTGHQAAHGCHSYSF